MVDAASQVAPVALPLDAFELPADPLELMLECSRRGWSDGMPVIPATPDRVERMVAASGRDPLDVVTVLPPRFGVASVEAIAVCAVMAGCEPRQFEAVLAAVRATGERAFNLSAVNATTHPVAQFVLLSGAAARVAGVHGGAGCFGPGFPANLAIGRALRMVQMAIGGATPGSGDRASMGTPAKIAFCTTEREDESPFEPFHVTKGFAPDDFCVTVFPVEGPANIQDHQSNTADGLLRTIAGSMAFAGSNSIVLPKIIHPVLAMGPEHARTIADEGFDRAAIQRYIHQHARFPRDRLGAEFLAAMKPLGEELEEELPIVQDPAQIEIIVTGGPGKHCMMMHGFSGIPVTVQWEPHAR